MVVQRGFTAPPSYHTDLARGLKLRGIRVKLTDTPVGYYFDVITHGFVPCRTTRIDSAGRPLGHHRLHSPFAIEPGRATLADVASEKERQRLLSMRGPHP